MSLELTTEERATAGGNRGAGAAMAMRILAEMGRLLGAPRLIPVASAHIDGALYHGDSGVHFAERLVAGGAKTAIPASLNVGGLDLLHPGTVKADPHRHEMALRLMRAYEAMGCWQTWTCSPYHAGHRPALGSDVAWGESNAVAFCNSVLGAPPTATAISSTSAAPSRGARPITGCIGRRIAAPRFGWIHPPCRPG